MIANNIMRPMALKGNRCLLPLNPRRQQALDANMLPSIVCSATNEADSLYKGIPVASGIIEKRLMDKQMKKSSKEFMAAIKLAEDDDRKVQLLRRESRTAPADDDQEAMVEYFLNTVCTHTMRTKHTMHAFLY